VDGNIQKYMKKFAIFMAVMLTSAAVFAQGTVTFNNRIVTAGVDFKIGLENPVGNFVGFLEGPGYSAQIWGGLTADSLAPSTPITTFRTGAAAGYVNATTANLVGVPADAASAVIQIRAWDNMGGTVNSWADVIAQDPDMLTIARGSSGMVTLNAIGGNLNTPPNLVGFDAFNIAVVPEPSTIALGILGGAALLFRLRKK
jgi:hypothetical protein